MGISLQKIKKYFISLRYKTREEFFYFILLNLKRAFIGFIANYLVNYMVKKWKERIK